MALPRKAVLWQQLKTAREMGVPVNFDKTYVQYTEAELERLVGEFLGSQATEPQQPVTDPLEAALAEFTRSGATSTTPDPVPAPGTRGIPPAPGVDSRWPLTQEGRIDWDAVHRQPLARQVELLNMDVPRNRHVILSDEKEDRAGLHFYTHGIDDPVRIDSTGKIWFQDEVIKPAIPKPRMRRVVKHAASTATVVEQRDETGHLEESFEISGVPSGISEHKVTMANWQTGIYKDPMLPFRLHIYNGMYAFDYRDVAIFFGGTKLIPTAVNKTTKYVGGDLCFDLGSVRDAIEREYRERVLGRNTIDV